MISWYNIIVIFLFGLVSIFVNIEGRSISQFLNQESQGTKWAVLVAGSNGWDNYRHQADVCHAYQLLKNGGLKDENIIVFMYDDIAHNRENPRPGVIINNPHGNDVYKGVPKDYVGEDVNALNFYNVILANKSGIVGGTGKVLNSGPNDHIFIYYTDHGGPGIVAMPSGELVYANDLVNVLKKKHASGTYDRLVFYLEACESGSMFDGLLPEGLDIYVMTASEPNEDSWATYCGEGTPEEPCLVQCSPPEFQGVCLGDLYSISWMEDSDIQDRTADSVQGQYSRWKIRFMFFILRPKVANRTAANITHGSYGSHVTEYGDIVVSFDSLAAYMGENFKNHSHDSVDAKSFSTSSSRNVDQHSTELFYLFAKHRKAPEGSNEKYEALVKLNEVKSQRSQVDYNVKHLGELLFDVEKGNEVLNSVRPARQPLVDNWDCLKSYVKIFEAHCGRLTTYGRRHVRGIANICNAGITNEKMVAMSAQACSS
uniref:Legumain prodomain domain-containing protein n=1 Tax=Solanum lycopersicum TaxID=4081 RepID=A0A3Q7HN40_SOLLC